MSDQLDSPISPPASESEPETTPTPEKLTTASESSSEVDMADSTGPPEPKAETSPSLPTAQKTTKSASKRKLSEVYDDEVPASEEAAGAKEAIADADAAPTAEKDRASPKKRKGASSKAKKDAVPKAKEDVIPKAAPAASKEKAAGLSTALTKAEVEYMFDWMFDNIPSLPKLLEEAGQKAGVTQKRNPFIIKRHWKGVVRTAVLKLYKE